MGRKVKTVPGAVPYVVDIDRNQLDWLEWRRLTALSERTEEEEVERHRLEEEGAHEPFWVLLEPYTGKDYNQAWAESELTDQRIVIDHQKKGEPTLKPLVDSTTMAKLFGEECVRKHVLEVHNYQGQRVVYAEGKTIATGDVITPKNGTELVDFITEHAWNSEYPVLTAIFTAMTNESVLEAGLGEGLSSPSDSSGAATSPSDGGAVAAVRSNASNPTSTKAPKARRKAS
ncbi:MAG: hypothetical protein GTO22_14560 [Gemmatimonadales bacterium]|nr:hypothetical protein [Gemmatimonadales bacterium]